MTDLLPGRPARSDVEVRSTLLAIAAVLLLVVLGVSSLALPAEWLSLPQLVGWAIPAVVVALAVALACGRYILETFRTLGQELSRSKELVRVREEERNLAQDEIVRRLQQERDLGRQKVQFEAQ